jgi:enamine deaminase RidA (YjgF/YER057c/UK114 family)
MLKPQYRIFTPGCTGSFDAKWTCCFASFQQFLSGHSSQKAFIVRVFVAAENTHEFLQRSAQIKQSFAGTGIPVSILSESPEKPNQVTIEAGFADSDIVRVEYGQAGLINYCKLSGSGHSEFWFAGIEGSAIENTISQSAESAFRQLLAAFLQLGLSFNQIVRQWNYVEQIFGFEASGLHQRQNYQLFNEVRSEYYSRHLTNPDFPAATGIGVAHHGVSIECMAVAGDENLKIISLSNPEQLDSWQYGQTVLKGKPKKHLTSNQPPQFERAKLMISGNQSRVFISGTASIAGQETIGLNDVEEQTRIAIDHIELLTGKKNLKFHAPQLTVIPDQYACVRVYVKNEADIPAVKAICRNHFGKVPLSFVQADICREDLLVEIEAEKIGYKKSV